MNNANIGVLIFIAFLLCAILILTNNAILEAIKLKVSSFRQKPPARDLYKGFGEYKVKNPTPKKDLEKATIEFPDDNNQLMD